MIFSFLIASIRAGSTTAINITNRCGVDGAVDHAFMVTLKPPPANNSNGRRLDAKDLLSYLQGWVHQYDPGDTSNDTARRKLEANSNSTQVMHLFTVNQLAVAVHASDDVWPAQHG